MPVKSSGAEQDQRYIFDSSSLIDLERANRLKVLDYVGDFVFPTKVEREIDTPGSDLHRWLLKHNGHSRRMFDHEGQTFLGLMSGVPKIDDAEAVAIAMAHHRGLCLVIEDGAGRIRARTLGVDTIDAEEFVRRHRLV